MGRAGELEPVDHHHRQLEIAQIAREQLFERPARPADERARDRRLRGRARLGLDRPADRLAHSTRAARRDAGQHPLEHYPGEQITRSELPVALERDLFAVIRAPHPRPRDRHTPPAERRLARGVTVTLRRPLPVVTTLRPHHTLDLVLHRLVQHGQAGANGKRQQPLFRRPNDLRQRQPDVLGKIKTRRLRCSDLDQV